MLNVSEAEVWSEEHYVKFFNPSTLSFSLSSFLSKFPSSLLLLLTSCGESLSVLRLNQQHLRATMKINVAFIQYWIIYWTIWSYLAEMVLLLRHIINAPSMIIWYSGLLVSLQNYYIIYNNIIKYIIITYCNSQAGLHDSSSSGWLDFKCVLCFRPVWPAAGGGGAGRSHGDGSDLHRLEERWKTPGTVLLRDHQVSVRQDHSSRFVFFSPLF